MKANSFFNSGFQINALIKNLKFLFSVVRLKSPINITFPYSQDILVRASDRFSRKHVSCVGGLWRSIQSHLQLLIDNSIKVLHSHWGSQNHFSRNISIDVKHNSPTMFLSIYFNHFIASELMIWKCFIYNPRHNILPLFNNSSAQV